MEFDLLILGKYPPEQFLKFTRFAERMGYEYLWCADEKFYRDPYAMLVYAGLKTREIKFGVCVTDPYTRHPAITAMVAATVAELLPGRFNLGIGSGFSGLYAMGINQEKPLLHLREAIELMRALWQGERVNYTGKTVSFHDSQLEFMPPGRNVPLVVAATGRKMLELAGELADGVIIGDYGSEFTLGEAMKCIRAGADRAGRPLKNVPITARCDLVLSDNRQLAIDANKPSVLMALWFAYPKWDYFFDYSPEWEERFAPFKRFLEARGDKPRNVGDHLLVGPFAHLVTDEMVQNRQLVGSTENIARQISSFPKVGVNRLIVWTSPLPGQTEYSVAREFAERVIPRVGELLE
jgi:5,10-methylenetetrahydromethanopterin reductase